MTYNVFSGTLNVTQSINQSWFSLFDFAEYGFAFVMNITATRVIGLLVNVCSQHAQQLHMKCWRRLALPYSNPLLSMNYASSMDVRSWLILISRLHRSSEPNPSIPFRIVVSSAATLHATSLHVINYRSASLIGITAYHFRIRIPWNGKDMMYYRNGKGSGN